MSQVLQAEREASDAVERCRAEAAQILAEAEEGAHRIAQRTEGRIKLAGRIADQAVERTLREQQDPGLRSAASVSEDEARELLAAAVDDLADEIVGGAS